MALLQALISFISKSAGKILNAVFGWAVVALFGQTAPKQHMLLTVLVAMAALWPLLLVGIVIPKIATMVLAFVPVSDEFPTWVVRIVWIVLSLAVPVTVGLVIAAKAPPGTPPESALTRVLRGIPVTMGIAGAFLLMFITVPALRIASALRGRKDEHVPLITSGDEYVRAADEIDRILERHELDAIRTDPSWWLAAPSTLLQKLGGKSLRGYFPSKLAYWKGTDLEIALYPSDILIRGKNKQTAWTHGLLDETFAEGPGLMTHDAAAQEIEKEIHRIWAVYRERPRDHVNSKALAARLDDVAADIGRLKVEYEQWQIVYRKAVQLGRALRGQAQLLQGTSKAREEIMAEEHEREALVPRPHADAPTGQLVGDLLKQSTELMKKELELAKAELRSDFKREIAAAKGLGVAGVCALCGLNLLLVAAVFGLATMMPGWAAALIVAGVVLAIGTVFGLIGWSKRVKTPLEKTQKTLKEDVQWAKERMA
jgi:hypothetical protein